MNKAANFGIAGGKTWESKDRQLKVMKLLNKKFEKEVVAKIYTIEDPDDLGKAKLDAVVEQAHACMRTSSHLGALFNYSYFKRVIPETKKTPKTIKFAILNDPFKLTLHHDFKNHKKLDDSYEIEEMWDLFSQLLDTLTFFENQHIHHGNISMNNIIVQVDEDTGDKTYQLADW
jgi:RIO-like serine/threonine protein kinase